MQPLSLPALLLLLAQAVCTSHGAEEGHTPPPADDSVADIDTYSGPKDLWNTLGVEHDGFKDRSHKCDQYEEVILEVMTLAVFSTDPEAKEKLKQLKANVEDLIIFNKCYEIALMAVEEEKLHMEPSELTDPRDGKLFGSIVKTITKGVNRLFGGGSSSSSLQLDVDLEIDTWGDNWNNWNNWSNWNNWNNWGEWCPWGGRSWNGCDCYEDLCCDCEPDRGDVRGSCCWNFCENICSEGWNPETYCRGRCSNPECRKFNHCCSNTCSPHISSPRRRTLSPRRRFRD